MSKKYQQYVCHDCNVKEGQIHEWGCDMEWCPFCSGQLIMCGCAYKKLKIKDNRKLTLDEDQKFKKICDKKGRVPFIMYPNLCRRCGKQWPSMFWVEDDLWEKVVEERHRGDLLCEDCFAFIRAMIETEGNPGLIYKKSKPKGK